MGGENYLGCGSKEGIIEIFDIKQKKWIKRYTDTDKSNKFISVSFNDVGSHILASSDSSSYITMFNTNSSSLSYLSSNNSNNLSTNNLVNAPINQILFSPLRSYILGGVSEKGEKKKHRFILLFFIILIFFHFLFCL